MRKSTLLLLIGILLLFLGVGLIVGGAMASESVAAILAIVGFVFVSLGNLTFFIAIVLLAIEKGYGAGLGILFAFLGLIGLIVLLVMPDKSQAAGPPGAPMPGPHGAHMPGPPGAPMPGPPGAPPPPGGPPGAPGIPMEEPDQVLFQGALNGQEANLQANSRLAQVALIPLKRMITDALHRRAEGLRLEPQQNAANVTLMIDGVPYPGQKLPKQQGVAIAQMAKLLAGLNIKERSKSQSGGIKAELDQTSYVLHVDVEPSGGAERMTIRAVNLKTRPTLPEDLGFTEEFKSKIRDSLMNKDGILLVCGPPRSGTTTTMYVTLRTLDAYLYAVFSIANTARDGHELVNVHAHELNPDDSMEETFERLRRQEAHILFMDPLKDAEMAKVMFEQQRQMGLLCEVDAHEPVQAILKCIEWVGDRAEVAEGLRGVITQKLLRGLCKSCKEAYRPNPQLTAKIGLPPETQTLYRPRKPPPPNAPPEVQQAYRPCVACQGLGYKGRLGLYEFIEMTEGMKEVIKKGGGEAEIKKQIRDEKMQTRQSEGLRLVAEGQTSLEELQRAFK